MRARISAIGLGVGFLAMCAIAARPASATGEFNKLTVDQVDSMVKAKSINVYDNNGKARYEKGHVPSATWLSIEDIKATDLPGDKDKAVVFYCGNEECMACHAGAKKAIEYGYKKVYIMPAGIAGWEKAGKTVEKG